MEGTSSKNNGEENDEVINLSSSSSHSNNNSSEDEDEIAASEMEETRNSDAEKMEEEEDDDQNDVGDEAKTFRKSLYNILKIGRSRGGDFAVSGELKGAPVFVIDVQNFGKITFPLYENQARQLIQHLELAPFGKGTETVVDTSVRNSWQLDPTKFQISNPNWELFFRDQFLSFLAKGFEFENRRIGATLYKLLLYESGSFFKPHRDTEKETGMFGTLIIQLPSDYEGGELVIKHDGKIKTIDFSSGEPNSTRTFSPFFSAFYCDCEHELLPVRKGYRVCLVYNLTSNGIGTDCIPVAHKMSSAEEKLGDLLNNWPVDAPKKMVFVLSHKYSKIGLLFRNLKTTDKTVADLLRRAGKDCLLTVALGQLTKNVTGQAEEDGGYDYGYRKRSRWGRSPSPDYSDLVHYNDGGDEPEINYSFSVVDSTDGIMKTKDLSIIIEEEVMPLNCFKGINTPNKVHYAGYTGNCPGTLDHWYELAALIFWPIKNFLQIANYKQFSLKFILDKYFEMIDALGPNTDDRMGITELSLQLLNTFGMAQIPTSNTDGEHEQVLRTMYVVALSGDIELIQKFLTKFAKFSSKMGTFLMETCEKYGWNVLVPELKVLADSLDKLEAVQLLRILAKDFEHCSVTKQTTLTGLVNYMLEKESKRLKALSEPRSSNFWGWGWSEPKPKTDFKEEQMIFSELLILCHEVKLPLLDFVKSKSDEQMLNIYAPACLSVVDSAEKIGASNPQLMSLVTYLKTRLEFIISAYQLHRPTFSRSEKISCSCLDCKQLQRFISANKQTQSFKMGNDRRRHLHQQMNLMANITHVTERSGNPFTLVVTKTHVSKQGLELAESTEWLKKLKAKYPEGTPDNDDSPSTRPE